MRVLMVSHDAVPGGSNSVVSSLLTHAPADVEARWAFLADGPVVASATVPTHVIEAGRAREPWKAPGAVRGLRRVIAEMDADVVFAHVSKAQLYASPAARAARVPELWWQHERVGQKPLMHAIAGRLPAAAVICSAEHTAAEQRERFPRTPVVRVHPGVETDAVAAPRPHVRSDEVVIGVVGRLQRWKRAELAIRAMPAVLRELPGARLRIVGGTAPGLDEDYPAELRAEAQRLGVAEAVELTGHVADGGAAIAELDVLVHCAELEPFGLVPVEAMLRGVPVVAPDAGGPRESVRDGVDGLLVDPADTSALAAAVIALAQDPVRRAAMGAAGHERALALFGAERMAASAWAVVRVVAEGREVAAAEPGA